MSMSVSRAAAALIACLASACAAAIQEAPGRHSRLFDHRVRLHRHALTLHLSEGYGASGPLLVYATGDAGWFSKDAEVFNRLVPAGYPLVGFSARDYVLHLAGGADQVGAAHVADDYAVIVAEALAALHKPADTPIILVGKSRGAGLAVAAASVPTLQPHLMGVLAIALTREEEHVLPPSGAPPDGPHELLLYDVLPNLGHIPVAVIQSTSDQYLKAAEAQRLFGPETNTRRFRPIIAEDHNFSGAAATMYAEMRESLSWIIDRRR